MSQIDWDWLHHCNHWIIYRSTRLSAVSCNLERFVNTSCDKCTHGSLSIRLFWHSEACIKLNNVSFNCYCFTVFCLFHSFTFCHCFLLLFFGKLYVRHQLWIALHKYGIAFWNGVQSIVAHKFVNEQENKKWWDSDDERHKTEFHKSYVACCLAHIFNFDRAQSICDTESCVFVLFNAVWYSSLLLSSSVQFYYVQEGTLISTHTQSHTHSHSCMYVDWHARATASTNRPFNWDNNNLDGTDDDVCTKYEWGKIHTAYVQCACLSLSVCVGERVWQKGIWHLFGVCWCQALT